MENTDPARTPYGTARIARLEQTASTVHARTAHDVAEELQRHITENAREETEASHQRIAEAITVLMDLADPEERIKLPEARFDKVTVAGASGPTRGDLIHDGSVTGLRVEVENAWVQNRVDREALLWARKLRLTPTGPHAERAPWAPRNYAFGFWGTWNCADPAKRCNVSPADAWAAVFARHGHPDADHADNLKLRFLLDARAGRFYADELLDKIYGGATSIEEAIRQSHVPRDDDMPGAR